MACSLPEAAETPDHHRPIRSYVLREGRLTPGQQRAFDALWPSFGVDFSGNELDLAGLFSRPAPVTLEVGFGNGESLATMAQSDPKRNFLGIEIHRPGVGHLLMRAEEMGLTNLRVMRADAMEVIARGIPDETIERFLLYFPDPWHKKRHHKRRFMRTETLQHILRILQPSGLIHAATDWQDYAESMLEQLEDPALPLSNRAGSGKYSERPDWRPNTKFERRGQALGHGVWDLIFQKDS